MTNCEHCGSDRIYCGPPECSGCGAPVCCQTCCKWQNEVSALESRLSTEENKTRELQKMLVAELQRNEIMERERDAAWADGAILREQLAALREQWAGRPLSVAEAGA